MRPSSRWAVTWACVGIALYLVLNAVYTGWLSLDEYSSGKMVEVVTYGSQWEPWRPYMAAFVGALAVLGWTWSPIPEEVLGVPRAEAREITRRE
jgi:hypothetical protein